MKKIKARRYKPLKPPSRTSGRPPAGKPSPIPRLEPVAWDAPRDEHGNLIPEETGTVFRITNLYKEKFKPLYESGERFEATRIMMKESVKIVKERALFHLTRKLEEEKVRTKKDLEGVRKNFINFGRLVTGKKIGPNPTLKITNTPLPEVEPKPFKSSIHCAVQPGGVPEDVDAIKPVVEHVQDASNH